MKPTECPNCGHIHTGYKCPNCGYKACDLRLN